MRISTVIAALVAALVLGGCVPPKLKDSSGGQDAGGGGGDTSTSTATGFTGVADIIRGKCAMSGCHGPNSFQAFQVPGGQSASDQQVQSALEADPTMVKPGDPSGSLLYQALTGQGVPLMPTTGKLSDQKIQIVQQWIADGASYE